MKKKIIAVTGCPTGIAHTFMAEEALKKAAAKLGCQIKVETNGAAGVENGLTATDIREADAVIVACDRSVDLERFNGKPTLITSVKEGINKADKLIERCLTGDVPIRKGVANLTEHSTSSTSIWHDIYKHLMNGVSHMLPLVVAGGVLIAVSFLWGIYSFDPDSSQYNPIAATLKQIGGFAMGLMVPVLAAFIAQSIANKPGMLAGFVGGVAAVQTGSGFIGGIVAGFFAGYFVLLLLKLLVKLPRQLEGLKSIFLIPIISVTATGLLMLAIGEPCLAINNALMSSLSQLQHSNPLLLGIIIGCMSAFDMGGPVNKAAYVTGTVLLGEGNYLFMAGVSAACITPPLIIALAATLFKNRFAKEDKTAAYVNYVLGFTHITEGAIPFAAKNPLKVIPVLMIGSSISAVLTYMAQIEVPAPHGGFLILSLVNKPLLWVGCILTGSFVGALLYAMVTPKVGDNITIETKVSSDLPSNNISLYQKDTIKLNLTANNKAEAIREMVQLLDQEGVLNNAQQFEQDIYQRENLSSTGFEMGVAIPHAKSSAVNTPRVAIGISQPGIDFDSEDGQLTHLIFMIATTDKDNGNTHLKALAKLSAKLVDQTYIQRILSAKTEQEILDIMNRDDDV
ncbi:PTS system D-fructose-specific IIA component (F1P-forming) (Frc family) /PTS system D-fructose-specific IIB component (F1P-forming) (Frc family) /PTS system D-fructose-specific IIC component (F1P-forming) (Frc family) [Volucribacter psittacicida]|uniref:PTS system D-fructose-specific IIA component (F1P-forming) (Frc family) /PTS system D-fructose-specific IIB component (F1P-forming) (Frc family) /PTS system D-fructose-specific IIC component (F1P-f... n=1 Tax=Volucribacter psittacicida TaxID=203482 RepID=A0A4V2PBU6_9PAST|nr:fructose-specific PTS transporter subunit EIIC [Volucribacter psittacicida]TCJ98775.1 PTS system D-fructose-specific IIA component (F1P-forming) (Frc family) /PTS system D-fructose-specific IIB component (F1P-forming) (Frc family) /PTS system D-fructose-specific IIC component (F1P-forming) (Frc family) [Volucribacter psittacicida]